MASTELKYWGAVHICEENKQKSNPIPLNWLLNQEVPLTDDFTILHRILQRKGWYNLYINQTIWVAEATSDVDGWRVIIEKIQFEILAFGRVSGVQLFPEYCPIIIAQHNPYTWYILCTWVLIKGYPQFHINIVNLIVGVPMPLQKTWASPNALCQFRCCLESSWRVWILVPSTLPL